MSRRSQLFVGRLPLESREKEVEEIFDRYGSMIRCDLKFGTGMAYAFVDYEDKRDAEDAIKYEHGRKFQGQTIVVEWARGPSSRPMVRKANAECYRCHRTGHWARDCPEQERDRYGTRRYSRSRSPKRGGRRSGSRSPGYYYRGRRRWRTPSQTRSPSYNRSRRPTAKKRTPSRSASRSRSGSKERHRDSKRHVSKSVSRSRSREKSRTHSPKKERSPRKERSRSPRKVRNSRSPRRGRSPRKVASRSRSRSPKQAQSSPRNNRDRSPESEGKDMYNGSRGEHRDQSITPKRHSRSQSSERRQSE